MGEDDGAGVTFDWKLAAQLIRAYKPFKAYAAIPYGPKALIWSDGKPTPQGEFKFAGTRCLELHIGDEIWNCFVPQSEQPGWTESTYWPEEALAVLRQAP